MDHDEIQRMRARGRGRGVITKNAPPGRLPGQIPVKDEQKVSSAPSTSTSDSDRRREMERKDREKRRRDESTSSRDRDQKRIQSNPSTSSSSLSKIQKTSESGNLQKLPKIPKLGTSSSLSASQLMSSIPDIKPSISGRGRIPLVGQSSSSSSTSTNGKSSLPRIPKLNQDLSASSLMSLIPDDKPSTPKLGRIPKKTQSSDSGGGFLSPSAISLSRMNVSHPDDYNRNGQQPSTSATGGADIRRQYVQEVNYKRQESVKTKQGTSGNRVTLQTNYFKLLTLPNWNLYQYRVDFTPDIEVISLKKGLVRMHKPFLKGYLFDGTVLFLTQKLNGEITELNSIVKRTEENVKITIKLVGIVSMTEASSLQVLNLILRGCLAGLNLQLVGRNFFDAVAKVRVPNFNLELWPGYITSIRQHEQNILLCTEITHKVMRTDTVYRILKDSSQHRDFSDIFRKEVLGMIVLTDYNNKTYRIDDVEFDKSPKSTFSTKNGEISFIQYYYQRYNIKIRDDRQPLLVSRPKARDMRGGQTTLILLVPELCRITGLSENMRKDTQSMRSLGNHTKLNPGGRIKKLEEFNRRITTTPESYGRLEEWQMRLDTRLTEVVGRELHSELIYFGGEKRVPTSAKSDWDMRDTKLYAGTNLNRWCVVSLENNMRQVNDFLNVLQQVAFKLNFKIANPNIIPVHQDRSQAFVEALEHCGSTDAQLVMIIVPNDRADRYSAIKKKCCVDRPIPSQVMKLRTITPRPGGTVMSVATKVAIQLSCKLGCIPWLVKIECSDLMTIGFDVCHDTCDKRKSYGAMVATMDQQKSPKFFSCVSQHLNGEELSTSFGLNIIKAIVQYKSTYGKLPARIIIYRDGVGDGQIAYVNEHEVNSVRERLEGLYSQSNQQLRLCFIIVSKRINTKLFKGGNNPKAGTIVDDVVTLPEKYDFYLVSQYVHQGTVTPTSYNVIYDTSGLTPDNLQMLTFKMCHLYYNWCGTTRVPAVCQYAHKLASLVGQYIHQDPSHLLEKQLFFL